MAWRTLDVAQRGVVVSELARALVAPHPLATRPWRAVAVGEHPDDIALLVDERSLWVVHLTWGSGVPMSHCEIDLSAVRIEGANPLADPSRQLLALDLGDAFEWDELGEEVYARARASVVFVVLVLMATRGLTLVEAKLFVGILESMGASRHEPGALSRALARVRSTP